MKKLVLALAVLASAVPALAQDEGVGEVASQLARGNPLQAPPGVYAVTAQRLAQFFGRTAGARTVFADVVATDMAAGKPMVLVDVRPAASYAAGHVPGAISLPLDVLFQPESLAQLPTDGTPIVLICATGHTESMSLGGLVALGYEPYVLRFGVMGWNLASPTKIYSNGQTPQTVYGLGGPIAR
jgi:rhodanese-related sulfurtransferase